MRFFGDLQSLCMQGIGGVDGLLDWDKSSGQRRWESKQILLLWEEKYASFPSHHKIPTMASLAAETAPASLMD